MRYIYCSVTTGLEPLCWLKRSPCRKGLLEPACGGKSAGLSIPTCRRLRNARSVQLKCEWCRVALAAAIRNSDDESQRSLFDAES